MHQRIEACDACFSIEQAGTSEARLAEKVIYCPKDGLGTDCVLGQAIHQDGIDTELPSSLSKMSGFAMTVDNAIKRIRDEINKLGDSSESGEIGEGKQDSLQRRVMIIEKGVMPVAVNTVARHTRTLGEEVPAQ